LLLANGFVVVVVSKVATKCSTENSPAVGVQNFTKQHLIFIREAVRNTHRGLLLLKSTDQIVQW